MNHSLDNQHLEQMLRTALEALTHDDVQPWVEMFAEAGIQEFPYAPEGAPKRLDGKPAVAAYLANYPNVVHLQRIGPVTFYHSSTASIAEFSAEGIAVSTGNSFVMPYVSIIEHHDGKITRYVDYWNPLVAMVAMGGLDAVQALGRHNPAT